MQRSCLIPMVNMIRIPKFQEMDRQTPTPISGSQATHSYISEPGPATGGHFYREDRQRPSVLFRICPDPSKYYSLRCQEWVAFLEVKCFDVPRLMREGFRWGVSNVIREEGYLEHGKEGSNADAWTATPTRIYFLADNHQARRWTARLGVKASSLEILYDFDLNCMSRELVRSAWAFNQYGREIYGYEAYTSPDNVFNTAEIPMMGFNMIYDKMPMEGFWPWPRKEHEAHTKEYVDEVAGDYLRVTTTMQPSGNSSIKTTTQSSGSRSIKRILRGVRATLH